MTEPKIPDQATPFRKTATGIDCLVVLNSFGGGGAERSMLTLANALSHRGLNVHVCALRFEGHYRKDLDPAIGTHPLGKSGRARHGILPLSRLLRTLRPRDVISALNYMNVMTLIANRLARQRARVHVSVHNFLSQETNNPAAGIVDRIFVTRAIRHLYPKAATVMTLTAEMADDLSDTVGLPRADICVLPNPIDIDRIIRTAEEPWADIPDPWLAKSDRPTIVALGRLHPQKDYPTLLEAIAGLPAAMRPRLVIFGEGPERGRIERQIAELKLAGDVALAGVTQYPERVLACARALVLSSRWEGMPVVLLEALALGCPVIATDCPTGPAMVLGHGRYGTLVPVGDPAAMGTAILAALDKPPDKAHLRSRAEEFAAPALAARYSDAMGLPTGPR